VGVQVALVFIDSRSQLILVFDELMRLSDG